jgi:hypothetical protein
LDEAALVGRVRSALLAHQEPSSRDRRDGAGIERRANVRRLCDPAGDQHGITVWHGRTNPLEKLQRRLAPADVAARLDPLCDHRVRSGADGALRLLRGPDRVDPNGRRAPPRTPVPVGDDGVRLGGNLPMRATRERNDQVDRDGLAGELPRGGELLAQHCRGVDPDLTQSTRLRDRRGELMRRKAAA